jgi:hypothetical protein
MQKIKSIQIQNNFNNGKLYEVGKNGVFEILDKSVEYTDSINFIYFIKNKDEKLISCIENCPVLIEYDVPENQKPKQLSLMPDEKPEKFNFKKSLIELGVEESIASDWLKVRSKKKASNTKTSFNSIAAHIKLKGKTANECIKKAVEKDWKGFNATWPWDNENIKVNPKNLNDEWN